MPQRVTRQALRTSSADRQSLAKLRPQRPVVRRTHFQRFTMLLRFFLVQFVILQPHAFPLENELVLEHPEEIRQQLVADAQNFPEEGEMFLPDPEDTTRPYNPAVGPRQEAGNVTFQPDVVIHTLGIELGGNTRFPKYSVASLFVHMVGLLAAVWCIYVAYVIIKRALRGDFANSIHAALNRCQAQEPCVRFCKGGPDGDAKVTFHGKGDLKGIAKDSENKH